MIHKLTLFALFQLSLLSLQSQQPVKDPVQLVEQGLRPDEEVVFADSNEVYNLNDRMDYYGVPSVSLAVIHDGKLAWKKAYGLASEDPQKPADASTLYQAASLSKSINALGIMKLAQDNRINLDEDIRTYLKTWSFPDNEFSTGKKITLRNLLSHTAGLGTGGFMGYAKNDSLPKINAMLDGKAPANSEAVKPIISPGTQFQYSGGGILITKKILLDNITKDYAKLLKTTVLDPLKMAASTFEQPLPSRFQNVAFGFDNNRKQIEGGYYIYPEQSPDGLWTTAADYAKFILSVQSSLKGRGGLLSPANAKDMLSPVLPGSDAALGTFVSQKGGEKYFFHTGANVGYRSAYYGSLTSVNGVVVLTNSDNGDKLIREIVNSVAVAYDWKEFYHPEVRKLVALPDSLSRQYAGSYHSDQPDLTITIRQTNHFLELAVKGNFEPMYFTTTTDFFLKSDVHTLARFIPSGQPGKYSLEVSKNGQVLFSALQQ